MTTATQREHANEEEFAAFSNEALKANETRAADLNISYAEGIVILQQKPTEARLRAALPLLADRNPDRVFKHSELAALVASSREKVTMGLGRLREAGEYRDAITVRRARRR